MSGHRSRGFRVIARPTDGPSPWTRAIRFSGTPASSSTSTSRWPIRGVISDGLKITPLPAASAGAILRAAIDSGKFQGVMTPTVPTGSRSDSTICL